MAIDINIPIEDEVKDGSLNPVTSNAVFDALAALPSGTVTSVGLTMPSAFTVSNSPIISSGDIAVTGAGVASQYVRGDGSLANFPTSSGGGASVSYYLNGSVSQGTFGGVAMREINKVPIIGAGTDFTINANGYIQSFITDANDPNQLEIPGGNWNFETYFSASSSGGNPSFYVELYKWDGATLSLIASNSTNPEIITGGTAIDLYLTALAVPQTTLSLTDRLVVRIYVTPSGRTIKLHTEDNHLSQIITTFSTGLTSLNGITAQTQNLATGTSGTDFAINSSGSTHTFHLPTASATKRGALSTSDWATFNGKQDALTLTTTGSGAATLTGATLNIPVASGGSAAGSTGEIQFNNAGSFNADSSLFWDNTNKRLGVGATPASTVRLDVRAQGALSTDVGFRVRNSANTANLFDVQGDGTSNVLTRLNIGFSGMTTTGGALFVYAGNSGDFMSRFVNTTGVPIIDFRTVSNGGEITIKDHLGAASITLSGRFSTALEFANSKDIGFGTSGGTKIGYATNQKFAFWNKTPIVQPTTAITAATFVTNTSGILNDTATFDGYTIGQVVKALRNIGILA